MSEIELRFGMIPNFFKITKDPETSVKLWESVKYGYLDAPFPSLFKGKLFTYLSQFCAEPYCLCRHTGFLLGMGYASGDRTVESLDKEDVLRLLKLKLPVSPREEGELIARFSGISLAAETWRNELDDDLILASAIVFLSQPGYEKVALAIRDYLGEFRYDRLMALISFVRTAHFWTVTHPGLELEEDIRKLLVDSDEIGEWIEDHFLRIKELRSRGNYGIEARERLFDLFENTTDLIQSLDPNGNFLYVNQAWLNRLGYTRDEVDELSLFDVLVPEQAEEFIALKNELMNNPKPTNVAFRYLSKGGEFVHVEGTTSLKLDNGEPIHTRCFLRDVTEQKRLESEKQDLLESLDIKIEFLDDVNSQLLPYCSCCQQIRDRKGNWRPVLEFLKESSSINTTETICPSCSQGE